MTRRTKLLLTVFAVVVAADVLLLTGFLRGCGPDAGPPHTGGNARGGEREGAVARGPAELETAPAEVTVAPRAPAQESELGPRRRGRVVIPAGTPADDERVVVCGSFASDAGDPLRVPVLEDGTFEARFPPSEDEDATGWVGLESRWLVLESDVYVALGERGEEIVLAPKLGARVRCTVVLPPGREDERAFVDPNELQLLLRKNESERLEVHDRLHFLRGERDVARGETWTLAPGRELVYESLALDPELAYEFDFQNARFVSEAQPLALAAGVATEARIVLGAGIRVRARVVDASGRPIAEAPVVGLACLRGTVVGDIVREAFDRGHHAVRTDLEGRFDLSVAAREPRTVVVRAEHEAALPVTWGSEDVVPGAVLEAPDFVMRDARIAGSVRWPDGRSAEYAVVQLVPHAEVDAANLRRAEFAGAVVAADGTFEVDAPCDGEWKLVVRDEKGESAGVAYFAPVRPGTHGLELVLAAVPELVVDVRDDLDRPVAFAEAYLGHPNTLNDLGLLSRNPRAGEDGRVRIPGVPDGAWRLSISSPQGTRRTFEITLRDAASRSVRVVLQRSAALHGRLIALDGAMSGIAQLMLTSIDLRPGRIASTGTDPSGEFEFRGLVAGRYELTAYELEDGWFEPIEVTLAPGEARTGLEVRLENGGALEVDVLDEKGRPDAGRRVGCSVANHASERVADERGRVRFTGLPPGRIHLRRYQESTGDGSDDQALSGLARAEFELARGEKKHVVLGGSTANGRTLRARVQLRGKPVPDVELSIYDDCAAGHSARTDALGRCAIDLHGPGRALLQVWSEECCFAKYLMPGAIPAGELLIEFPTSGVRGRARSTGGATLPEVLMLLPADQVGTDTANGFTPVAMVEAGGAFEFRCVEPGKYTLAEWGRARKGLPMQPVEVKDGIVEVEFVVP